nr:(2Fe-2S)-binding protein [Chroococcidiopsis sp. CCNUC1]
MQNLMQTVIKVNGKQYTTDVEPRLLLVDFLRDILNLTGTKSGCDTGQCGACTVMLNGVSVKSCTVLAVQADGSNVMTIEGVAQNGQLSALQEGFWNMHGLQCGYCTPAMIMSLMDLLQNNPKPSEAEIRDWLDGVFCRCGVYPNAVRAVHYAVEKNAVEKMQMESVIAKPETVTAHECLPIARTANVPLKAKSQ